MSEFEVWCSDCDAQFRNECTCSAAQPPELPVSEKSETWVGIDGHTYIGDPKRASLAYHADNCKCYTSEDWN